MNNIIMGKTGAVITGLAVLSFAVSMVFGLFFNTIFLSCLSSIFIAVGFIPFMVSLFSKSKNNDKKAVGLTGIAFAAVYAVIIFLVYYAECTTIRMNPLLSDEALSIISYGHIGSLFFNYDLLGYGFMGLSTFLIAFTIEPKSKGDKVLRGLLWGHGVFFLSCLFVPMFPVFTAGTSNVPGTILLEIWCAYFIPICILGYRYFHKEQSSK
ncbi:hypothetical protein [Clostridium sp. BNL1100]|uniref:hypothetical protein n=1 Tax=Clostridium sp. BNL1100 TaxID=755731 RepID=UPI00024A75AB|nr:hypothetical protein [Clostridium sp. BNL1100]AEY65555.1 hypothetical protein Clo1100_1313 [Clostridium sp. BNL1100]